MYIHVSIGYLTLEVDYSHLWLRVHVDFPQAG